MYNYSESQNYFSRITFYTIYGIKTQIIPRLGGRQEKNGKHNTKLTIYFLQVKGYMQLVTLIMNGLDKLNFSTDKEF